MKKLKALLKVVFFICTVIIFYDCNPKTGQSLEASQNLTPEVTKPDSLKPWEQKLRINIQPSDSVLFYNNEEINISKSISQEYNYVENGVIFSIDSNRITKLIPRLTPFKLKSLKYKNNSNDIDVMIVSATKNRVEYILSFFRKGSLPQGTASVPINKKNIFPDNLSNFILSSNAVISYKRKTYNISVKSDFSCILYVDYRKIVAPAESSDQGWSH